MKDQLMKLDPLSRRQFAERTAAAALGVSILPYTIGSAKAQANGGGKAKHCIFFYMSGGMTHMDTFDPKPGTETGGKTAGASTGVAGVELSEFMPKLAAGFKDIAVVRSMTQKTGDHRGGSYWMRTSYNRKATIIHPSMGPWAHELLGASSDTLPSSVTIGAGGEHPGSGFFGPSKSPLPIGDPDKGVQNAKLWEGVDDKAFEKRLDMTNTFDASFRKKFQTEEVKAYTQFYDETLNLMKSDDLEAFELTQEENYQAKVAKYGDSRIGKGALLAKRLVERDVRFIEVNYGGWDMHNDLWNAIPNRAGEVDMALASLIEDLKAIGKFDETLICLATEFGRTPKINANGGRDHYPRVFSSMFAGGGIVGGQTYGSSDSKGMAVEENPVTPADFNATIAHSMGLPLDKVVYSPSGRPFLLAGHKHDPATDSIVSEGKPILDLFT